MKTYLFLVFIFSITANAHFLEKNILKYSSIHCSDEFNYRISEVQKSKGYVHYIYDLKDKKNQNREENYNGASFSFNLENSKLIEVTCPAKDQGLKGKTHHFEID